MSLREEERVASERDGAMPCAPPHVPPHARPDARLHAQLHAQLHAMSFDIEEFFQVRLMRPHYARSEWEALPSRVEASTDTLLELLADTDRRATFFTLGWVAERHPRLIRRIVDGGHEIASHGQEHALVHEQTEQEFSADVLRSKKILEDVSGERVQGYRAANFSIGERTPWAYAALAEAGYTYSSSSHPVRNPAYGATGGSHLPHRRDGVAELPVTTLPVFGQNLPCAGGGYFRLFPYLWTRLALAAAARRAEAPMIFYLHPWEVDPDQPRPAGLSRSTRIRHYTALDRCADRLRDLLTRYQWHRIDQAFAKEIAA